MEYLDTSYIIALSVLTDVNHELALKLEQFVKEPVISILVVLELYTYYSRKTSELKRAFSGDVDASSIVDAMVEYSLKRSRARQVDVEINSVVEIALKYAPIIPLKTLDLLHLMLAYSMGAEKLVTLDKEYARYSSVIERELSIEIVHPWSKG